MPKRKRVMNILPAKFVLQLYITGDTVLSRKAITEVKKIVSDDLKDNYRLEIVDLLLNPEEAERYNIMVTPTLIRTHPKPKKKIIGDLSNKEKLLTGLDLTPRQ
jgi:circadian clock protein KaiB